MENQNLLSLALNHPRLNCERRKHKNKDMVFCVKVSWFSNKVHASHNNLTDFFKEKKLGGQKRPLSVYNLYMYILKQWLTPLFCPLQQQHPPRFQWKVNAWDRCIWRYHHLNEQFEGGSSLRSRPLPIIPLSLSRAKETKKQKKKTPDLRFGWQRLRHPCSQAVRALGPVSRKSR